MGKPFVLGIAGGSGAGKSTIVDQITSSTHAAHISLLPHDAYYRDGDQMPKEIMESRNWDHPEALDNRLFLEHLQQLVQGKPIRRPIYDFGNHRRKAETVIVEPRPVLLVEGILILAVANVRSLLDLRVFVDAPPEERLARRLLRDIAERNRTLNSVIEQYRSTVQPMHDEYVAPSREHAHLIIPWAKREPAAVEVLLARISQAIVDCVSRE